MQTINARDHHAAKLSIAAFLVVMFLTGPASAQLSVAIETPADGSALRATSREYVRARVEGGAAVSVTATLGSQSIALSAETGNSAGWFLGSLVPGCELFGNTESLVVVATDAAGNTASASVQVVISQEPVIKIMAPVIGEIARDGTTRVLATCRTSDRFSCTLRARIVGETSDPAWSQGPTLDTLLPLSGYQGKTLGIVVEARDSVGVTQQLKRTVLVESSARLRKVIGVTEGEIFDFDGTRALALAPSRRTAAILEPGAAPQLIPIDDRIPVVSGSLFPGGALVGNFTLWDGSLRILAEPTWAAGAWLVSSQRAGVALSTVGSGVAWQWSIPSDSSRMLIPSVQAAANGDVLWTVLDLQNTIAGTDLWWRHAGAEWQLGRHPWGSRVIDGVNAVAAWHQIAPSLLGEVLFFAVSPGGSLIRETLCSTGASGQSPTHACGPPVVNAGWTAYSLSDTAVPNGQLWRRAPSGEHELIAQMNAVVNSTATSPMGEVVFSAGTGTRDAELQVTFPPRYVARPASTPLQLSSSLGTVIWRDNWFVLLGRSVFALLVDDDPDPSEGPVDAQDWAIGEPWFENAPLTCELSDAGDAGTMSDAGALNEAGAANDAGGASDADVASDASETGASGGGHHHHHPFHHPLHRPPIGHFNCSLAIEAPSYWASGAWLLLLPIFALRRRWPVAVRRMRETSPRACSPRQATC